MSLRSQVEEIAADIKAARGVDVQITSTCGIKLKHDLLHFNHYYNRIDDVSEMYVTRRRRHWGKGFASLYSYKYDIDDPAFPVNMIDDIFADPREEDRNCDIVNGCMTNSRMKKGAK